MLCRAGKCFMKHVAPVPTHEADVARKAQATGFRLPTRGGSTAAPKAKPKALHDPQAANALLLNPQQPGTVAVVVDPYICR
jgi:hypothetical protein